MYIIGNFFKKLQMRVIYGKKIALLIIDEENKSAPGEKSFSPDNLIRKDNTTTYQQTLLMFMQAWNCPVWSISHRVESPQLGQPFDVTRTPLKALYNGYEHTIRKRYYNAFRETDLYNELKQYKLAYLAIMGWHANVCVTATVGASWWPLPPEVDITPRLNAGDGATHLGYKVMTCNQILHGEKATWSNQDPEHFNNLEFYSMF